MCGIIFSSFTSESSINTREIARVLLLGVENRGPQATGVAWVDPVNLRIRGFNAAETASKFVAGRRFRTFDDTARTFIGHTRFATKGSLDNPLNNHPVYAYDEASGDVIAAVHNGGVWNDDESFRDHKLIRYAQVDSEIIPAMIARYGSSASSVSAIFNELEGGIATAWLDERVPGTLHCVRASDSPMCVMTINLDTAAGRIDGVVGASTESALVKVLDSLGIDPLAEGVVFYGIGEGEFFTVNAGVWDRNVIPFELPDLMQRWGGNWRSKNRATQTTHSSSSRTVDSMSAQAWAKDLQDEINAEIEADLDAEYGGVLSMAGYTASYDPMTGTTTYVPTSSLMGRPAVLDGTPDGDDSDSDYSPADAEWWETKALEYDLVQLGIRLDDRNYVLTPEDKVLIDMGLAADIDIEEMFGLPTEVLDGTDDRQPVNYSTGVIDPAVSTGNAPDVSGIDALTDRVTDAALAVVSRVVSGAVDKITGTGWPKDRPVEDVEMAETPSLV